MSLIAGHNLDGRAQRKLLQDNKKTGFVNTFFEKYLGDWISSLKLEPAKGIIEGICFQEK